MNLPNYFLADLPPEATISAQMISEACQTLRRNREQYLATRSTQELIELLAGVAEGWLQPANPFRQLALGQGTKAAGFLRPTLATGLDNFFKQLTEENLKTLLLQELGHAKRLDGLAATAAEERANRSSVARGPEFLVHIAAGNIPNPTLMSIVLGVLVRSAQFVKCASGTSFLPRLFAHSLYDADRKLGACLEIADWRGGNVALEDSLFAEADCVTATGNDETLAAIQTRLPAKARFLGYGHRVSFGYVAASALSGFQAKKTVPRAAADVIAWNQLGCLSPHVFYVQTGGDTMPKRFAEMLAEELDAREANEPRGELSAETSAAIASRRAIYEVRAAKSLETHLWCSKQSTAWTVVYEEDLRFQTSCLHRFIYVKPVSDLVEALHAADALRGRVSTVGIAVSDEESPEMAAQLARWGATRVCKIGQMQNPPLLWRHDGRPALGDLVTWTDFEQ
ncbi:MAG TPA: acyl-CoA reductase [Verrucomicrobiota bacterium]|nr:acyl-CoA reductase [Verrucomicrobiota bacterium]